MKNIKLFESFTKDQYNKAFNHIKSMLDSGKPNSEIIKYIEDFNSDKSKQLNSIRLIIGRIQREINNKYCSSLHYNTRTKPVKKRKAGSDWFNNWNAGDVVNKIDFDIVKYYAFSKKDENKYSSRTPQSELTNFIESQKNQYNILLNQLTEDQIELVKYLCDRFFEILDWIIETGPKKYDIMYGDDSYDISDDDKKKLIDELNDFDFENEYDEVNLLVTKINTQISKLL